MFQIDGYKLSEAAVEAFVELRNDQPARDRLKYFSVAAESVQNPQTRVKLVQKLYADLMKHGDIDFGPIPASKGDLTRYKHYDTMVKTLEAMEKLLASSDSQEYAVTERLFNMIIACRSDFEYGFKFDVHLIQLCYNVLVMALHRMIDLTMMKYVESLRQQTGIKFVNAPKTSESLIVFQAVKGVLSAYDKGEWTEMINSFKKGRCNWLGTVGSSAKALGLIDNSGIISAAGASVLLVIGMIVIIIAFRKLVYLFYSSAYKINDAVERSKQFLEYTLKNNVDQTPTAIVKQEGLLSFFNKIHDVIETKIFSDNEKAKKKLTESNKANFTMADIRVDNYSHANIVDDPVPQERASNSEDNQPPVNNEVSFF